MSNNNNNDDDGNTSPVTLMGSFVPFFPKQCKAGRFAFYSPKLVVTMCRLPPWYKKHICLNALVVYAREFWKYWQMHPNSNQTLVSEPLAVSQCGASSLQRRCYHSTCGTCTLVFCLHRDESARLPKANTGVSAPCILVVPMQYSDISLVLTATTLPFDLWNVYTCVLCAQGWDCCVHRQGLLEDCHEWSSQDALLWLTETNAGICTKGKGSSIAIACFQQKLWPATPMHRTIIQRKQSM